MLSDEEKEALKNFKSEYETCDHYSSDLIIDLDDAEIILNLIDKQQKEIEELQETNMIQRSQLNSVWDRGFIHKDKIKAKIEEIDNMELCSMRIPKLSTLDERLGAKIGIKYVLQSLLAKEE